MTLELFLTYFGALVVVLITLYGTKNFLVTLIPGFIIFCVFYFEASVPSFEWTLSSMLPHIKDAAIIYIIMYPVGAVIYKIFPTKHTFDVAYE